MAACFAGRGAPYNQSVINRVAETLAHCKATLTLRRMWSSDGGPRLGVALSGGGDSVFLLYALRELGVAAAILHVNHGLRGSESDRDEAFVRDLARHFHVPCHVFVAPVIQGNTEQEARRLRYRFFRERIALGHCDAVATGHTLDDQAETVLYRFLRGSGTAGLSGIRPVHVDPESGAAILRPLLGLSRDEIRHWLRDRNIEWREDSSNANHEFARNRIRNRHLPELTQSINPGLPQVLASTAEWAQAEEDYWDGELDRLQPLHLERDGGAILTRIQPLCALPLAVQRRLLRRAMELARGSLRAIDFAHVEATRALLATAEGSGRLQLPDLDIYRSFDWLRLSRLGYDSRLPRDFAVPLPVPGGIGIPERQLTIESELVSHSHVYNSGVNGVLDRERCESPLVLRNWQPGDRFQRPGHAPEKIKTLFQENRIPLWERRGWPVVASGQSVVWSRRFGVSADYAAGPDTRNAVLIREVGPRQVHPEELESNPLDRTSTEMTSAEMKRDSGAGSRQTHLPGAEVL